MEDLEGGDGVDVESIEEANRRSCELMSKILGELTDKLMRR